MLTKLGFHNKLVDLFMTFDTSAHYQICHAGKEFGSISPERGIRHEDLLSSYLFLVCTEGFTALIKDYERMRLIRGIQVVRGAYTLSHMIFADDSYLYYQANKVEADHAFDMLRTFEKASSQQINIDKSLIFFNHNTEVTVKTDLWDKLLFYEADDNNKYLGLPNIMGKNKTVMMGVLEGKNSR